jgi:hypothetical protein
VDAPFGPSVRHVELRFQFRYAAPPAPRLLQLDPHTLCFSAAGLAPSKAAAARKKVEQEHVTKALAGVGQLARYNQLRQQVMDLTDCSRRTAQLAIAEACAKAPSCRPAGSTGCRFELPDFAPGRAGADPAPRGAGPEAGDGSAAQTCSSVPPAGTSIGSGGVRVFQNRILGSASELVLGVKTRRCHGALFAPGLSLWIFSRDTTFCLHSKVSYPGLGPWLLTGSASNVRNTVENVVRMRPG